MWRMLLGNRSFTSRGLLSCLNTGSAVQYPIIFTRIILLASRGHRSMSTLNDDKAPAKAIKANEKVMKEACGDTDDDDELEELEEMFVQGPAGMEWGGPTRGGARPEPTRFNDWERKGRCSDF